MNRRAFLCWSLFAALAVPLAAEAQPAGKVYRVGWLDANPTAWAGWRMAFLDGLKNLGWTLGRDFVFEWRQPDSHEPTYERLPRLPGELVGAQMDMIVAWGGPATETARAATKTIPVVFVNVDSPSLSTPAANVTDIFNKASELAGGAPPVASGIGARSLSGGRTSRSRQARRGGSVRTHEAARALGLQVQARNVMQTSTRPSL